jgi:hypothetical protein
MWIRRLVVVLGTLLVVAPAAQAGEVRMFAVGNKHRIQDAVTYGDYRNKMAALMDAQFPNRSAYVQAGVDDVVSHLRPADPRAPGKALVVFPEDVGLMNILIGSRGATSRRQTSALGAVPSLFEPYSRQVAYYAQKYPGQPALRVLFLALTDTLYRSFYETFRDLAREHGVYIAAAMNAAPATRVEASDDPQRVALLGDPDEPGRPYVYEAASPYPGNTTYLFAPDGEVLVPDGQGGTLESPSQTGGVIRGSTVKAYLTPPEQPPPGEFIGLALAFGAVPDMEVLDTPVGRLATVISKDAWMVDVNDRFEAKGANVILQPEAFSDWGFRTDEWAPDVFKEGGFANLQKYPAWQANVDASLTGTFFDSTFDGQSAILGRRTKGTTGPLAPGNAWIGQNPDTGFRAIAPWIEPDPGIADPSLTLAQRRQRLAGAGVKLLIGPPCPDSLAAGQCRNGYRESIVWHDVSVPDGPVTARPDPVRAAPPVFERSVRASGNEKKDPVTQHAPRVAAHGRFVYTVWHEDRGGLPSVRMAVSRNGGRTFHKPLQVSDNAGSVAELYPTVAATAGEVSVAWQELADGRSDDRGRVMLARFDEKGRKRGGNVRVDDTDEGGKWLPQVAYDGTTPVLAWIDERDRGPQDLPLEHVYAARGTNGGGFGPNVRVDAGAPVALSAHLDNKWSPTIAASDGKVYVAWADFRRYNWDIFSAASADGGRTFGANVQVDDFPGFERVDERPSLVVDPLGRVHAAWTDLRAREPDTNIFYSRSDNAGASFSANRQLDDSRQGFDPDRDTPTNQWHPTLVWAGDSLFAAWQDNRLGNDDVFFTRSADGGATFAASERVDDTGSGRSEQSRPHMAWANGLCHVVWEDNRSGNADVFTARRPCAAPPGKAKKH